MVCAARVSHADDPVQCAFLRYRYSEDDVVSFVVQALQGLEYLHNRRILHLDIKPDNIMVSPTNVLKIVDFGSAQSFNPLFLKPHNCHLSTLEFMGELSCSGDERITT